jgi:hypothetical protein
MVAVPVPPFQHSPMLGHCASSHTVCRPRSRRELCRYSKRSPCDARWRSHGGLLAPGSAASCGPARAGRSLAPVPGRGPSQRPSALKSLADTARLLLKASSCNQCQPRHTQLQSEYGCDQVQALTRKGSLCLAHTL